MNYWIRAYNHSQFRIPDFIRDKGFIDMTMRNHYHKGDIVFIYGSAPESRITFMMEVETIDLTAEETEIDERYFISQNVYDFWKVNRDQYHWVRLTFLKELGQEAFRLSYLKEHGMRMAPQSPRRLSEETVDYIMSNL